ncbi:Fc.00g048070.m01.CDS01 [Cosmosporella sp. VM-42]
MALSPENRRPVSIDATGSISAFQTKLTLPNPVGGSSIDVAPASLLDQVGVQSLAEVGAVEGGKAVGPLVRASHPPRRGESATPVGSFNSKDVDAEAVRVRDVV